MQSSLEQQTHSPPMVGRTLAQWLSRVLQRHRPSSPPEKCCVRRFSRPPLIPRSRLLRCPAACTYRTMCATFAMVNFFLRELIFHTFCVCAKPIGHCTNFRPAARTASLCFEAGRIILSSKNLIRTLSSGISSNLLFSWPTTHFSLSLHTVNSDLLI